MSALYLSNYGISSHAHQAGEAAVTLGEDGQVSLENISLLFIGPEGYLQRGIELRR